MWPGQERPGQALVGDLSAMHDKLPLHEIIRWEGLRGSSHSRGFNLSRWFISEEEGEEEVWCLDAPNTLPWGSKLRNTSCKAKDSLKLLTWFCLHSFTFFSTLASVIYEMLFHLNATLNLETNSHSRLSKPNGDQWFQPIFRLIK